MCEISLESQMLSSVAIFLPKQDLHIGAVSFKERRQINRFRGAGGGGHGEGQPQDLIVEVLAAD